MNLTHTRCRKLLTSSDSTFTCAIIMKGFTRAYAEVNTVINAIGATRRVKNVKKSLTKVNIVNALCTLLGNFAALMSRLF